MAEAPAVAVLPEAEVSETKVSILCARALPRAACPHPSSHIQNPAQGIGRRGSSFKPSNASPRPGLARKRVKTPGAVPGASREREERAEAPKLSPWLLGLMLFAVALYPLAQMFSTLRGNKPTVLPGAR